MQVKFYKYIDDSLLKFAVIVSRQKNKWVLCKHKDRTTYEVPGGHRESGERILDTAKRELFEETGAIEYDIEQVCTYSVVDDNNSETFVMLYFADIKSFGPLPELEIEQIYLMDELPENWTYPEIQPLLTKKIMEAGCL